MNQEDVCRSMEQRALLKAAESLVAAANMLGLIVTIETKRGPLDPTPKMIVDVRGTRGKDYE